tara:strand:- start:183 stop:395 length:213 start_codon:yes stop_codon:yes gene_type:complete
MKKKIEKLLEIVEKIESLNNQIDILNDNIKMYPNEFVHLKERDRRSAVKHNGHIVFLEYRISEIAKTLTR